nr:putative uncharacterized protein C3orf56 [Vicugna pacos]
MPDLKPDRSRNHGSASGCEGAVSGKETEAGRLPIGRDLREPRPAPGALRLKSAQRPPARRLPSVHPGCARLGAQTPSDHFCCSRRRVQRSRSLAGRNPSRSIRFQEATWSTLVGSACGNKPEPGEQFSPRMGSRASKKEAAHRVQPVTQTSAETHVTAPVPCAAMDPAGASCPDLGAQPVTGPACWPDMRPSWAAPSWMWHPAPWGYVCTSSVGHLWIGYPCPVASVLSVWTWGISSVDPLMGRQHAAPLTSGVFPYPVGPPPPYSSVPPAPSGDASGHCTQEGWQTPTSSAPPPAVEGPSRGASYSMMYQFLPSEWASRLSIWAPKPSSSPELCPLPPSPSRDPQGEPRCPQLPRSPSRVCRRLF